MRFFHKPSIKIKRVKLTPKTKVVDPLRGYITDIAGVRYSKRYYYADEHGCIHIRSWVRRVNAWIARANPEENEIQAEIHRCIRPISFCGCVRG